MESRWKVYAGGAVVSMAALYLLRRATKKAGPPPPAWTPTTPGKLLDLLPAESSPQYLMLPAPATLTFYEGDAAAAAALLHAQVKRLVAVNPWLAGRLRRADNGRTVLWIPDKPNADDCFRVAEDNKLELGQDWIKMNNDIQKAHSVLRGWETIDRDEPLFRVALVKLTKQPKSRSFVLLISMSHLLGDGHTYYSLYGSLSCAAGGVAPTKLNPERQAKPEKLVWQAIGMQKIKYLMSKAMFYGGLLNVVVKGAPRYSAYLVNTEWLAEQKAAAKGTGETGFVSSNDVLTSWFLSTGKYDSGCMVFNLRDRIPGYDSTHAGNYQSMIHFWPEASKTAVGIRKALSHPPFYFAEPFKVPSAMTTMKGNWGFVSSWISFYSELKLPGCTQLMHTPSAPPLLPVMCRECAFLFQATPTQAAVLMAERDTTTRASHPCLGKRLY